MQVIWTSSVNLKLKLWILVVSKVCIPKHTDQAIEANYEREKVPMRRAVPWWGHLLEVEE